MATPLASPATTESSTLYFGPWYRRSPFFEKTLEAGCSAYDIYNHMYLPGYYGDPVEEYWALLNGVTLWDVSVERIVEISGPDASAFINTLTCRDLTKCAVGQGKYVLITAEDGGIVNDPVLLRVEADRWWLALADSDAGLWARGVAINSGMDVRVREPEVYPVQVQGPKSKYTLVTLFGLERLVERQDADYIGKAALEEIRVRGVDRKLVGLEVEGKALPFELSRKCRAFHDGQPVGTVTDLIWSPRLERNIGYVWVPIGLAGAGNQLEIEAPDGGRWAAMTAAIPFLDPRKDVPKS